MKSSLIGCAFVSFSLLALAGCSGSSEDSDASQGDSVSSALRLGTGELELRVVSERVPSWLLRVSSQGSTLSGHAVLHLAGGGTSDAAPGNVTGTLTSDGSVTLFIEPPAASRPLPAVRFEGSVVTDGIEGTLEVGGRSEPVKLVSLAPGATDESGAPLLATTRHEAEVGNCVVDVTGAEFFALSNDAVEQRLNELFQRVVTEAPKLCAGPRPPAYVSGGGRVTLLRNTVVSVASVYTVLRGEEHVEDRAPERHTFNVRSGKELALFGDVLEAGSESKMLPFLEAAVDAIRSDVLDDAKRAELKNLLAASLTQGRLATHYGLTDEAVVFDVPDFEHPRITGVRVPYAALGSLLRVRSSL